MEDFNANEPVATPQQEPTPQPEQKPYKAFSTQQEYDDFCAKLRKSGEDRALNKTGLKTEDGNVIDYNTAKKQWQKETQTVMEAEIRAKIERENKMTAEELFNSKKAEFEKYQEEKEIEFNKREATLIMRNNGFSEKEIELELNMITADREKSLSRIVELSKIRKESADAMRQQLSAELAKNNPNINLSGNVSITPEQASKMTIQERTELFRTRPELYKQLFSK